MRDLIELVDLMETDLNTPLEFMETMPGKYFFSFDTPDGKLHTGEVSLNTGSTKPIRADGRRSKLTNDIITTLNATNDVEFGYLEYAIDEHFRGFNTQGFARRILSTVVSATLDWIKKHPSIKYIVYTAATNDGTNNRPAVYQALSALMSKKYGFNIISNNPSRGQEGLFILQVKK